MDIEDIEYDTTRPEMLVGSYWHVDGTWDDYDYVLNRDPDLHNEGSTTLGGTLCSSVVLLLSDLNSNHVTFFFCVSYVTHSYLQEKHSIINTRT